jgi:hypothetical protein
MLSLELKSEEMYCVNTNQLQYTSRRYIYCSTVQWLYIYTSLERMQFKSRVSQSASQVSQRLPYVSQYFHNVRRARSCVGSVQEILHGNLSGLLFCDTTTDTPTNAKRRN